jgi:hypothetical protein
MDHLCIIMWVIRSQDGPVGIQKATGLYSWQRQNFSIFQSIHTCSGAQPAPYPLGTGGGGGFTQVKWPRNETDHSSPIQYHGQEGGTIPPLPVCLHGLVLNCVSTGTLFFGSGMCSTKTSSRLWSVVDTKSVKCLAVHRRNSRWWADQLRLPSGKQNSAFFMRSNANLSTRTGYRTRSNFSFHFG